MNKEFKQRLSKYTGRNAFSEITNLGPTEFRSITNRDLYSGMAGDYMKTRRGSNWLVPEDDPQPMPDIDNKVVFPTFGGEFLITVDEATGFLYACKLPGNPYQIGGPFIEITGAASTYLTNLRIEGWDGIGTMEVSIEEGASPDTANIELTLNGDLVASTPTPIDTSTQPVLDAVLSEFSSSGISALVNVDAWTNETADAVVTPNSIGVDAGLTPDFKIYNDRVYVFAQSGNLILYYDATEGRVIGRPMGLQAPIIVQVNTETPGDMPIGAQFTWGIEKVTQKNDADYVASSPNRKRIDGQLATLNVLSAGGARLEIQSTELEDDPYWTHLRLWRSKSQTSDFSDPLTPLDAQGTPDQLYEVALITREEMFGTLGPVDTGNDLPPGNAGVEAGVSSGDYIIIDTNSDDVLVTFVGLDLIGLIPLPGCRTGAVNKGRIWASGIGDDFVAPNGPMIDPTIREDALYTTEQFSQYQEQWDAQAYLVAGRDGKETSSLQVFQEDVIVIRQDTTRRVASGNPASLVQMLDDKVGVPSFRMTGFITGIGICAICSDGYFRYLGFDNRWHQYIGKIEVSQSIYDLTLPSLGDNRADFVYMNGKLIMLLPSGQIAALGVKEGKGWVLYDYSQTFDVAFNFASGSRAAAANGGDYIIEIETDTTTDADGDDLEATTPITWSFETYGLSGEGGLLEISKYSFWGKLTSVPTITAKSSNITWQMRSGFIDPGLFAATSQLNEREYLFEPMPQDVTPFKFVPLRGQFVSFLVSAIGPAMISWQNVKGLVRPTKGNLGVYASGGIIPQGPGWANSDLTLLNFEDPDTTFYDASGHGYNFEYVSNGGGKTNRVTQNPGKGLSLIGGSYILNPVDQVLDLTGSKNLVWKFCLSLDISGTFSATGISDDGYWQIVADASGIALYLDNGTVQYTWTCAKSMIAEAVYVVTLTLSKTYSAAFYIDALLADSFFGVRASTRVIGVPTLPADHSEPVGAFSAFISSVSIAGWNHEPLYGTYDPSGNGSWTLYLTAVDRDAQTNAVLLSGNLDNAATGIILTEQNGSGLSGNLNAVGHVGSIGDLDLIWVADSLPTGDSLEYEGTVSYYEIEKSDPKTEQAKRFWGIVKSYG